MASEGDQEKRIVQWREDYRERIHDLRDQFDRRRPTAFAVASRAETVLRRSISEYNLKCEVTSRIKDFNSFRLKFRNKFHSRVEAYEKTGTDGGEKDFLARRVDALLDDPFEWITDVIGVRCVGLFTRELYPFNDDHDESSDAGDYYALREIIKNKFDDAHKAGQPPAPAPRPDEQLSRESGYRSVHFDLRLKPDSVVAALEQELLRMPFELQLRTYAQHMVDDVTHFLSYKHDKIFFPEKAFQTEAARLHNELTSIQLGIDRLFEESRRQFAATLRAAQNGDIAQLLEMSISPDTLKLYAMFEFIVLGSGNFHEMARRPEDAKFVDLWLRELCDGLQKIGLVTIRDVQTSTRKGLAFVERYIRQPRKRKTVFKQGDLTDILSKCLLFSEPRLREIYPILPETRKHIDDFMTEARDESAP